MTINEYMGKYGHQGKVGEGKYLTLSIPIRTSRNLTARQVWYYPKQDAVKIWCDNPRTLHCSLLCWDNAPKTLKKKIIDQLLAFD